MEDPASVALAGSELAEFLGRGGTGVVSFPTGSDEPPYSIPVSYGYEPSTGAFYFRLAFEPDSAKRDVVDDGTPVSFVTYDDADGWRSVVATGRLDAVGADDLDETVSEAMRRVEIPLVDVFDRPPREVSFRFFRLDPDEVTGRAEAPSGG